MVGPVVKSFKLIQIHIIQTHAVSSMSCTSTSRASSRPISHFQDATSKNNTLAKTAISQLKHLFSGDNPLKFPASTFVFTCFHHPKPSYSPSKGLAKASPSRPGAFERRRGGLEALRWCLKALKTATPRPFSAAKEEKRPRFTSMPLPRGA